MENMSSSRPFAVFALGALLASGCASSASSHKEAWGPEYRASISRKFNADSFASQFVRPADCERAARELQPSSRDAAWASLKACIARHPLLSLRQIASPAWASDLQGRPDAPALLTRVIAQRGGAIANDLQMLHEQQVPLFTLSDGLAEPELYKGRYVLFRAKVTEMREDGGTFTAKLDETELRSESFDAPVGVARQTSSHKTYGGSVRGSLGPLGPSNLGGTVNVGHETVTQDSVRKYDNVTVETGREALVSMPEPNPFLEPGKEFIVLARFDGVRTTSSSASDDDPEVVPVLTLISFHPPSPLVIY